MSEERLIQKCRLMFKYSGKKDVTLDEMKACVSTLKNYEQGKIDVFDMLNELHKLGIDIKKASELFI